MCLELRCTQHKSNSSYISPSKHPSKSAARNDPSTCPHNATSSQTAVKCHSKKTSCSTTKPRLSHNPPLPSICDTPTSWHNLPSSSINKTLSGSKSLASAPINNIEKKQTVEGWDICRIDSLQIKKMRRGGGGIGKRGLIRLWLLELVECTRRSGAGSESVVVGEAGGIHGEKGWGIPDRGVADRTFWC
jgi:hypothetical protein